MTKFEKISAEILFQLMHPLLIPMVGLMFGIESNSFSALLPATYKMYLYIILLIAIYLIPMSSLPLLKNIGTISDYRLSKHKERAYPGLIVLIGIYFVYKTFSGFQIPITKYLNVFFVLLLAFDLLVIIGSLFINFSLRALLFSGMIAYILHASFVFHSNSSLLLSALILFMGLSVSLELKMKRIELREVLISLAVGFTLSFSLVFLLSSLI